ncbi:MAG TPA: N-acetylmuramoyl-L-alanine amidase [Gemmatimonadaceae bacterium]|nr:N-acetylmuramoyl-L-alanine amidase [Gemmatimonadaceae bacterium]
MLSLPSRTADPAAVRRRAPALATAAAVAALLAAAATGCGPSRSSPHAPTPAPAVGATAAPTASRGPLPPVPRVVGPLDLRVVYPTPNALVQARDSNFIFGSVGSGDATLTINGAVVPVAANGAFLAWLPVPTQPQYELVAVRGADTARLTHAVRLLPPRLDLADTSRLVVDSASVAPRAGLALPDAERVRVAVRANAASVLFVADSAVVARPAPPPPPMPTTAAARRRARVRAAAAAASAKAAKRRAKRVAQRPAVDSSGPPRIALVPSRGDRFAWSADVPAAVLRHGGSLVVARGADTLRFAVPPVAALDSAGVTRWALAAGNTDPPADSAARGSAVGRPTPGGTYKWFLLPGTPLEITGHSGDFTRVRLDAALEVWIGDGELAEQPRGTPGPTRRTAGNVRVVPSAEYADVVIPTGTRPAYLVEELPDGFALTLYNTVSNSDVVQYVANDSLVRTVRWTQETSDRARYDVRLARAPYGYETLWNGSAFVLRVRRPPVVDRAAPLRGMTIAVDPGHPPIGATGPTGLYEPVPTLAVGERVKALLEARGARVVMTRTTAAPVALYDRPVIARRADVQALVSIHLNALPDGINPFTAQGTGTYFFHPQSEPLARAVQRGMVRRMGLRDLGVYYDNLALARPTWMPSVLCEGAFLMIPEQEAAMRTPEYQEAYARGIVDGIEEYFRALGEGR